MDKNTPIREQLCLQLYKQLLEQVSRQVYQQLLELVSWQVFDYIDEQLWEQLNEK